MSPARRSPPRPAGRAPRRSPRPAARRGAAAPGRALEAEDRRLEADRAGAAVEHRGDPPAEAVEHVRRGGRADRARADWREGAASGPPKASSRRRASGCAGTRTATVGRPAVAASASPASGRRGSTSVSGPGQKRSASARASDVKTASASAAPRPATCTISGLNARPALGGEDARDRAVVAGVAAEAVDGLGREGDQLARAAAAPTAARRPRSLSESLTVFCSAMADAASCLSRPAGGPRVRGAGGP